MLSPSYALSQLGVPYSDLMGDAAAIQQRWNDVQTIYAAFKAGIYTPAFTPVPMDPATIDPNNLLLLENAQILYDAARNSGNISAAHTAVDTINKFRALTDGQAFGPPEEVSDLAILGHSPLSVGTVVRMLDSQAASGTPPLLYTPQAQAVFDALNKTAALPAPPPPPNSPVTAPVPAGVTIPAGTPFINPADGSKWVIYTTPFGSVMVRLS